MNSKEQKAESERKLKKLKIIELLQKMPNKLMACQKVGISRQTIYRWELDDLDFAKEMNEALRFSRLDWVDRAEGKMFQKIEAGDSGMIRLYLKNNSDIYRTKRSVSQQIIIQPSHEITTEHLEAMRVTLPEYINQEKNEK